MGKRKKRKGTSKYNAIKIKDSSSSGDDESMDSDSTKDAGEAKANAAEVVHESIGMKTHSGKNRGRKVLTDAENKLLLVYPFKGADEEMLVEASTGMIELSGHRLGVKDEMDVEEVEATPNDSSDQNNDEATVTSTQRKEGATKRNAQYTETKRSKAKRKKLEPQKKMGEVGYTFRKQFDDGWFEGKGAALTAASLFYSYNTHSLIMFAVCHLSSWTVIQIRKGAGENSQSRLMFQLMPSCLLSNH